MAFSADMAFVIMLPTIAILAGLVTPALSKARHGDSTLFIVALTLVFVGLVLLSVAKLPLYREKRFFTIGVEPLPESCRKVYRAAWVFTATGLLILLLLNVLIRM